MIFSFYLFLFQLFLFPQKLTYCLYTTPAVKDFSCTTTRKQRERKMRIYPAPSRNIFKSFFHIPHPLAYKLDYSNSGEAEHGWRGKVVQARFAIKGKSKGRIERGGLKAGLVSIAPEKWIKLFLQTRVTHVMMEMDKRWWCT